MPVTRQQFAGKSYAMAIMLALNFALFVAIANGQAVIYWSITSNALTTESGSRQGQNLTIARRLVTVVVTDFLCWFPVGVLGIAAWQGNGIA